MDNQLGLALVTGLLVDAAARLVKADARAVLDACANGATAILQYLPVWTLKITTLTPGATAEAGLLGLVSVNCSAFEVPLPPGFGYMKLVALSTARNAPEQVEMLVARFWMVDGGMMALLGAGGGGGPADQ